MTDLEINKALALAIGWTENKIESLPPYSLLLIHVKFGYGTLSRTFDYRDWNVIGPIAKRYRLVVDFDDNSVCDEFCENFYEGDTPQKAIAMAVIKGAT